MHQIQIDNHQNVPNGHLDAKPEQQQHQQHRHDSSTADSAPLTLEQFRALVGIPQSPYGRHPAQIAPPTIKSDDTPATSPRALTVLRLLSRPGFTRRSKRDPEAASEYATSLYFSVLREESDQYRLYHAFDIITYACLILQVVIASALIVIGAIPSTHFQGQRIAIAVLGAVTGLLTGLLSLLKGQGLPNRPLMYAARLAEIKHRIEFLERSLRARVGAVVTFDDVKDLWTDFATAQKEQMMNRPDVWATADNIGKGGSKFMKTAREGEQAALNELKGKTEVQIGQGVDLRQSQTGTISNGNRSQQVVGGKPDQQATAETIRHVKI